MSNIPKCVRDQAIKQVIVWLQTTDSRGKVWQSSQIKLMRLSLTRYLAGAPFAISSIKQDKVLLPSSILPLELRKLIELNDENAIKFSLTILTVNRSMLGGTPVDLSPITNNWEGTDPISDQSLSSFVKRLGSPKVSTLWTEYHWTAKSGPNGPALVNSLLDLIALQSNPKILKAIYLIAGPDLESRMKELFQSYSLNSGFFLKLLKLVPKLVLKLRKLSIKEDKECKSRIFAILDYWSQTALRPLHNELFNLLRRLPGDCTFDQGRLLKSLAQMPGPYYSYDLSNATDRFPLSLQLRLLERLSSPEIANSWRDIMVSLGFELNGKTVFYNTGQPMGAHSSWPLFTLCHHLVVYAAARDCHISNFRAYALLGDDIVIAHSKVAERYKELMLALGVEISLTKSHVSMTTFEFAKRWYHHGVEVTPYPLMGLIENMSSWPLLVDFLCRQCPMKGYTSFLDFSDPVRLSLVSLIAVFPRQQQILLKRMEIACHLPHYSDLTLEGMTKSIKGFFIRITDRKLDIDDESLVAMFTEQASNFLDEIMAGDRQRLLGSISIWIQSIINCSPKSVNPDDQGNHPTSADLKRWLPHLSCLDVMSMHDNWVAFNPGLLSSDPKEFWQAWRNVDLVNIPKIKGILPERKRERMTSSQSIIALKFSEFWLDMLE